MIWIFVKLLSTGSIVHATTDPATVARAYFKPKFQEQSSSSHVGEREYSGVFQGPNTEILVQATRVNSPAIARQMIEVHRNEARSLYSQRISPYAGQLTSLVQCDPKLKIDEFQTKLFGEQTPILCGGASTRKTLGACSKETAAYWACQISAYDTKNQVVLLVRHFMPFPHRKKSHAVAEELSRLLSYP